jgi:hypothetical protein
VREVFEIGMVLANENFAKGWGNQETRGEVAVLEKEEAVAEKERVG